MFANMSNPDADYNTDDNGELVYEVNDRVIWYTKGPAWVGRVVEVLGNSEYLVAFGSGDVKLHAEDIALY